VALNLGAVYMLVLINDWNRVFYDALQNKDQPRFWRSWGASPAGDGLHHHRGLQVLPDAAAGDALARLDDARLPGRWLATRPSTGWSWRATPARPSPPSAPDCRPGQHEPDNPDQRIQEDVNLFTAQTVGLSMGLLNAVVTLASFVGICGGLSGAFSSRWAAGRHHHSRLHGVDGRAVLRCRQRADALHRPPADR
jgi:putative ATP-binding cassette transporter